MSPSIALYGLMLAVADSSGHANSYCSFGPQQDTSIPFQPLHAKTHTAAVNGSSIWTISMGGTVDTDSTLTPSERCKNITFQPNIELLIENVGNVSVRNPRLAINGWKGWHTIQDIITEALDGATSDEDKMYFTWDFLRKIHQHASPLFDQDELHDPVKYLNMYGSGLCDDVGRNFCSLMWHANFTKKSKGQDPRLRALHGHMQGEVFFNGSYHFMDIDENMFYLDVDNELALGGDDVAQDHDFGKREHGWMGPASTVRSAEIAVALFGRDDTYEIDHLSGHTIDLTLRPGEKVIFRWDNVGKFASDDKGLKPHLQTPPPLLGNSMLVYSPDLSKGMMALHKLSRSVRPSQQGIIGTSGTSGNGFAVFELKSPYVICGGNVTAVFIGATPSDGTALDISLDGHTWRQLWSGMGKVTVEFDKFLEPHKLPSKYSYFLRARLPSHGKGTSGPSLQSISITTYVMVYPLALPRLALGSNTVEYTDETKEPHSIVVRQSWQESSEITPPPPPSAPLFPAHAATIHLSNVTFRWQLVPGAVQYHIFVSRRSDMRVPYRAQLDTITDALDPSFGNPSWGLFSPGVDYFWQVRSKEMHGLWGSWSSIWSFRWEGPRAPVSVNLTTNGCENATLAWKADLRGGLLPTLYEVYGSDERGFTPHKDIRNVEGRGTVGSNLVTVTSLTSLSVNPLIHAFYRVVAVDHAGTRSGGSRFAEVPRPCVYTCAPATATVGHRYVYQMLTGHVLGDLQFRYEGTPPQKFWEEEGQNFTLVAGPTWLSLDSATGKIIGVPPENVAGKSTLVRVLAQVTYPHDVKAVGKEAEFTKAKPAFTKSCVHEFMLSVRSGSMDVNGTALLHI